VIGCFHARNIAEHIKSRNYLFASGEPFFPSVVWEKT